MTGGNHEGVSFRTEVASRLREVEKEFRNRAEAAAAAGVSKSTFQRLADGQTDISLDALALLASASGYNLAWLAFGLGPKRRVINDKDVAAAIDGGWIDGDLLEEILSKLRGFMVAKRHALTLERYQRLGHDLYNQVARFPTAAERNAALQVLLEREVPGAYAAQTAHERADAARFWAPRDEASK